MSGTGLLLLNYQGAITRSNGVQVIIDKLHTGRFEQHYLDHFLWYNNTRGKKEEEESKDEDLVFIVRKYPCFMLVTTCLMFIPGERAVWAQVVIPRYEMIHIFVIVLSEEVSIVPVVEWVGYTKWVITEWVGSTK